MGTPARPAQTAMWIREGAVETCCDGIHLMTVHVCGLRHRGMEEAALEEMAEGRGEGKGHADTAARTVLQHLQQR